MKATRRSGRKRVSDEERKTEVITVKVSKPERDLIYRAARSDGDKPYNWCRRMLMRAANKQLASAEK